MNNIVNLASQRTPTKIATRGLTSFLNVCKSLDGLSDILNGEVYATQADKHIQDDAIAAYDLLLPIIDVLTDTNLNKYRYGITNISLDGRVPTVSLDHLLLNGLCDMSLVVRKLPTSKLSFAGSTCLDIFNGAEFTVHSAMKLDVSVLTNENIAPRFMKQFLDQVADLGCCPGNAVHYQDNEEEYIITLYQTTKPIDRLGIDEDTFVSETSIFLNKSNYKITLS